MGLPRGSERTRNVLGGMRALPGTHRLGVGFLLIQLSATPVVSLDPASALSEPAGTEVAASAQGPRLDVGSFTLYVNGQRAGREQFSLQSITSPDGGAYELRAESAIGERRSAVRLETDSAGTPVRYAVEERAGAVVALRLGGQRIRGRFATLARSTRGEAAREYLLSAGAIVLEEEGVHQYAMLVRSRRLAPGDTLAIPTLTPIENRQSSVRLVLVSRTDSVTIAGSRRDAWCWRAVTPAGDIRTIWADADGRVLRLRIPSRGFEAVRDDIPR